MRDVYDVYQDYFSRSRMWSWQEDFNLYTWFVMCTSRTDEELSFVGPPLFKRISLYFLVTCSLWCRPLYDMHVQINLLIIDKEMELTLKVGLVIPTIVSISALIDSASKLAGCPLLSFILVRLFFLPLLPSYLSSNSILCSLLCGKPWIPLGKDSNCT